MSDMKNIFKLLIIVILSAFVTGCAEEWLEEPKTTTILLPEQVWNDPLMVTSLLANLYDRIPVHSQIDNGWANYSAYDEGMAPGTADLNTANNNILNYAYNRWTLWDYGYIRDINLSLNDLSQYSTVFTTAVKRQYRAELRYLRAFDYFEMVKRMEVSLLL